MKAFKLFKTIVMKMEEGELVIGDYKFFFVKETSLYEEFGISFMKKENSLCLIKPYGLNKHFLMNTDYINDQIIEAIFDVIIKEDFSSIEKIIKDSYEGIERMKYC